MRALSSVLLGNTRTNRTQHGGTELHQPSTGDCLSKLLKANSNQQLYFKDFYSNSQLSLDNFSRNLMVKITLDLMCCLTSELGHL